MSLFGRPNPEDVARRERQDKSRAQLEGGGLTLDAERRLRGLHGQTKFFTSNLSVNEFVLAASSGIRPLGQVMGSTIYHVGWQFQPMRQSAELVTQSHAQHQARALALGRLQQEAQLLGAHGVVGVHLERRSAAWGDHLIEWTARGTAIVLDGEPLPDHPFVSALSGQDYWALRQAGFHPVGFAFGTCVYYNVASYATQWSTQGGMFGGGWAGNRELTDYTQAVYTARHAAQTRMAADAARVGAEGIVGVTIETDVHTHEVELGNEQRRRDLIASFTFLGTAIVSDQAPPPSIDYCVLLTG
jgi:uncharacterized protein YbjQ (UPF0145 family)